MDAALQLVVGTASTVVAAAAVGGYRRLRDIADDAALTRRVVVGEDDVEEDDGLIGRVDDVEEDVEEVAETVGEVEQLAARAHRRVEEVTDGGHA